MKLFSELIGSKIILAQERALVGPLLSLVISPNDGSLLGFSCFDPIKKRVRYVAALETRKITSDTILIAGYESLSDLEDVVRIKESVDKKIKIIGAKVMTRDGKKIGRVNDAALNTNLLLLERIYVTPNLKIKFLAKDIIVSAKNIEEILPGKIIIKNDALKSRVKSKTMSFEVAAAVD